MTIKTAVKRRLGKLWCNKEYDEVYSQAYSLSYIDSTSIVSKTKQSVGPNDKLPLLPPALPPAESESFSFASIDDSNDGFVDGRTSVDLMAIALDLQKAEKEMHLHFVKALNPTTTIENDEEAIEIIQHHDPESDGYALQQHPQPTVHNTKGGIFGIGSPRRKAKKKIDVAEYHARANLARERALSENKVQIAAAVKKKLVRLRRNGNQNQQHEGLMLDETRESHATSRSSSDSLGSFPRRLEARSESLSYIDSISMPSDH